MRISDYSYLAVHNVIDDSNSKGFDNPPSQYRQLIPIVDYWPSVGTTQNIVDGGLSVFDELLSNIRRKPV